MSRPFLPVAVFVLVAISTVSFSSGRLIAQDQSLVDAPSWYWYRVEVTSLGTNHYRDKDSGITIVTRGCREAADGTLANLMWSEESDSWIAFDGGESCDVVKLGYTPTEASVSGDLVGCLVADVQAALGPPGQIDGARWTYQGNDATLYLYVVDEEVSSVRPEDVRLWNTETAPGRVGSVPHTFAESRQLTCLNEFRPCMRLQRSSCSP